MQANQVQLASCSIIIETVSDGINPVSVEIISDSAVDEFIDSSDDQVFFC